MLTRGYVLNGVPHGLPPPGYYPSAPTVLLLAAKAQHRFNVTGDFPLPSCLSQIIGQFDLVVG